MYKFSRQEKLILIIFVILIMTAIIWKIIDSYHKDNLMIITSEKDTGEKIMLKDNMALDEECIDEKICIIHITGAVKNPGVYSLVEGKRIIDAVKIAGGEEKNANLDAVNLAAHLYDGQKIIIPFFIDNNDGKSTLSIEVNKQTFSNNRNIATSEKKLININAANSFQLENLPGIGTVLAKRIIEYRKKNGAFRNAEEVMNVSGVGEKKYESIKEYITVY